MAVDETQILELLKKNYEKSLKLMTHDLAAEFQKKSIRPDDLKTYASSITVAIHFKDVTAALRIENMIGERFTATNFNRKLKAHDIDPVKIYEQLLQGFFDYK